MEIAAYVFKNECQFDMVASELSPKISPIVKFCNCSIFCYAIFSDHFSFAIILMEKRELDALLSLSSWCLMSVL